ncbi:hypothetical protein GGX14DRAFT_324123, partial [Mycena pura]
MSSFNVVGFFALAEGRRTPVHNPGTGSVYHCHYATSLKSQDDNPISAALRVYSAFGDSPLPDNTIVFAIAKAFYP